MAIDQARPILVVDDDAKIVRLVRTYLERDGHEVVEAGDGRAALAVIKERNPALVILDVMLPELDGLSVVKILRARDETPIIILSARGTTSDRVTGLGLGADDYLPKPFSPAELVVRVQRVLARTDASRATGSTIEAPGLRIDRDRRVVEVDARPVSLTATEYSLLVAILEAGGRLLSRDQLLDAVYGRDADAVLERTIDVHVGRLRRKLADPAGTPRFIATVRGAGYRAGPTLGDPRPDVTGGQATP